MFWVRGGDEPPLLAGGTLLAAQQPLDALLAYAPTVGLEFPMHARTPVGASAGLVGGLDLLEEPAILLRPRGRRTTTPSLKPAARNDQHVTLNVQWPWRRKSSRRR